jgi:hypothetical protein
MQFLTLNQGYTTFNLVRHKIKYEKIISLHNIWFLKQWCPISLQIEYTIYVCYIHAVAVVRDAGRCHDIKVNMSYFI